ncbi:MAG TPA: ATP-binding protein [Bryobacteraceae bacterium]|jgi:DNA replication protein DnaC
MNITELQNALRQLRLSGMAQTLETRLRQAQAEPMAPIDLLSCLISDELAKRSDRLLERRRKQADFRDPHRSLDNFDFAFNPKMNRSLIFDLATGGFVAKHEDALFPWPGWHRQKSSGPSHRASRHFAGLPRALSRSACPAGRSRRCRGRGTRKQFMTALATVPLLIIDDFGMRKLPLTAAEDPLEIVMRRYERASTLLTSNRPIEDWGKVLGDTAAVSSMLDRLLHYGHLLKCGPRSWRIKTALPPKD